MTISNVVTQDTALIKTVAPALPVAPVEYQKNYHDQVNNILRLYFNQVDKLISQLSLLLPPQGSFHQDGYTTLSTTIPNGSSTANIVVASTDTFLSSGALLIDSEFIGYTGKTSTTFTGITRGLYGSTAAGHTAGVYVSEAQAVPSTTTAIALPLSSTDSSNQVYVDPLTPTRVYFDVSGYYNIQFSVQLATYDNTIDDVTLWFADNGVAVPNSAGIITVPGKHGGVAGSTIASWNIIAPVVSGHYIEMYMSSNTGNTLAVTYPPGSSPTHPSSPSLILTATYISGL